MEDQGVTVEGEALPSAGGGAVQFLPRVHKPLDARMPEGSYMDSVMKVDPIEVTKEQRDAASAQGVSVGRKTHPYDFDMVGRFQSVNVHHARCIHAKVSATVGLGFQTPNAKKRKDNKENPPMMAADGSMPSVGYPPEGDVAVIDQKLDMLCENSWQDTINDVCEDFYQTGNGYLEVVRGDAGEILGLHHLPAKETYVVIENALYDRHYAVQSNEDSAGVRYFARFGEREEFMERMAGDGSAQLFTYVGDLQKERVSEVIHFRRPTALSRYYGYADWLSCVSAIELAQCLTQHEYDFFLNRGVPEFMLFILGQKLHPKDKERIETAMRSTIGLANQHKSLLVNLASGGDNLKVQLEKLAMESKSDGSQYAVNSETLALKIVTAHGVPPLLAGIQIPGKLGASNEMIQAMQAFQTLVIGPAQRLFRQTLMRTLGSEPSLGLTPADLVLNTITDEIDVQKSDTMARMRQSPQQAQAEGRDLDEGVKKSLEGMNEEERGGLFAEATNAMLDRLIRAAG